MKLHKKIILFALFTAFSFFTMKAQDTKVSLYNPKADAKKQIDSALVIAKKDNKHVLVQIGGNWCSWCLLLHKFYHDEPKVDSAINSSYVVVYINYSPENKNPDVLERLEFPQRFGFPVLIILDSAGKRIHTQNTSYLEKGRGYDIEKVLEFLAQWSPIALKPETYKK